MKKLVCGALSLVLAACCMTACSKTDDGTGQDPGVVGEPSAVTDFEVGDIEIHESILPWQFEAGEEVENPYYKRTVDETGGNAYAVLKASDNQVAYLPMSNTVVYMGDSDDCYFERTTNTYKLDGEDQTVVQFQLCVTNGAAVSNPDAAAPEVDFPYTDYEDDEGASISDLMLDEGEFPVETDSGAED